MISITINGLVNSVSPHQREDGSWFTTILVDEKAEADLRKKELILYDEDTAVEDAPADCKRVDEKTGKAYMITVFASHENKTLAEKDAEISELPIKEVIK